MTDYKTHLKSKILNEVAEYNDRLFIGKESPAAKQTEMRGRELAAQQYIEKGKRVQPGEETRSRFARAVEQIRGMNPVSGIGYTPIARAAKEYVGIREPNIQTAPSIYKRKEGFAVGTTEPSDFEKTLEGSKSQPSAFRVAGYTPAGRVTKLIGQKMSNITGKVASGLGSAADKGINFADKAADAASEKLQTIGSRGADLTGRAVDIGLAGARIGGRSAWSAAKKTGGFIKDMVKDEWAKTSAQSDQAFLDELAQHETNLHREHSSRLGISYGDYKAILRDAPPRPPTPVIPGPNYREDLKEYESQKRAWNAHVELHRQIHGLHKADSELASTAREIERHKKRMMNSLDARTGGSWRSYTPPLWASESHDEIEKHFVD